MNSATPYIKAVFSVGSAGILLSLFSPSILPAAQADIEKEQQKQEYQERTVNKWWKRIHFSVTGRQLDIEKLNETETISPLDRFIQTDDPWTVDWKQDMFYGTLAFDVLDMSRLTLSSGLHLGISQGEFSATDTVTGFNEWWRTEPAFLWGMHSSAEIFSDKQQGIFLRLHYNYFSAQGDEEKEVIHSAHPGNNGEEKERTATFHWKNLETEMLIGWHFTSFAPLTGLNYSRFKLRKKLSHHITETGDTPFESQLKIRKNFPG